MAWFIICNHFTTKSEMPKPLYTFCGLIQRALCYCFPRTKEDDKKYNKKDVIFDNGYIKKSYNKESLNETNIGTITFIGRRELSSSSLRKQANIKNAEKKQDDFIAIMESNTADTTENSFRQTPAAVDTKQTDKSMKPKCDFCNRCKSYQAEFDKDKAKGKNKKDIEARCSALNYFVFLLILFFMFVSNMALWLSMSQ